MSGETGAQRPRKHKKRRKQTDYSKQMIADIRSLLWVVTVGGLLLAAYCIRTGYTGALPWLTAMVGLPWSAHGVVCANYLSMAKSEHKRGGITYETAKANGFLQPGTCRRTVQEFSGQNYDDCGCGYGHHVYCSADTTAIEQVHGLSNTGWSG